MMTIHYKEYTIVIYDNELHITLVINSTIKRLILPYTDTYTINQLKKLLKNSEMLKDKNTFALLADTVTDIV